jgi:hypothetical protein
LFEIVFNNFRLIFPRTNARMAENHFETKLIRWPPFSIAQENEAENALFRKNYNRGQETMPIVTRFVCKQVSTRIPLFYAIFRLLSKFYVHFGKIVMASFGGRSRLQGIAQ